MLHNLHELKELLSKRKKKKVDGVVLPMNPMHRLEEKVESFGIELKIKLPEPQEPKIIKVENEKTQPVNVTVTPNITIPSPKIDFSPNITAPAPKIDFSPLREAVLKNKTPKVVIKKITEIKKIRRNQRKQSNTMLDKLLKRLDEPLYTKSNHPGGTI